MPLNDYKFDIATDGGIASIKCNGKEIDLPIRKVSVVSEIHKPAVVTLELIATDVNVNGEAVCDLVIRLTE